MGDRGGGNGWIVKGDTTRWFRGWRGMGVTGTNYIVLLLSCESVAALEKWNANWLLRWMKGVCGREGRGDTKHSRQKSG